MIHIRCDHSACRVKGIVPTLERASYLRNSSNSLKGFASIYSHATQLVAWHFSALRYHRLDVTDFCEKRIFALSCYQKICIRLSPLAQRAERNTATKVECLK